MKTATINISLRDKTFKSEFPIQQETPEYKIADEAFRLGMLFAHTQMLAQFGKQISEYEFAKFLEELDYTYEIKEEKA